jgi:predicted HAD superfamily phosphohydrolase YqeG
MIEKNSEINCNSTLYTNSEIKMVVTSNKSQASFLLNLSDKIDIEFYGEGTFKPFTSTLEDLVKFLTMLTTNSIKPYTTFRT